MARAIECGEIHLDSDLEALSLLDIMTQGTMHSTQEKSGHQSYRSVSPAWFNNNHLGKT